jgi:hypothetical protein
MIQTRNAGSAKKSNKVLGPEFGGSQAVLTMPHKGISLSQGPVFCKDTVMNSDKLEVSVQVNSACLGKPCKEAT